MSCNNCNGHNCNCNHGCSAILVDGNFTYQAWADDRNGTNFSLSPTRSDGSKYGYTAIIIRDHVVDRLVAKDFEDRWFPIEGFIVVGDDISLLNNDIPYLKPNDNVSLLINDVPYLINSDLANYLQQGDNISLLNNDMMYINNYNGIVNALGYIPENEADKNQPGGYPSLDSSGKVPLSQLPNINFAGQIFIYDTEVEMNASTGNINGNLAILQNPSGNTKSYLYYEGDWLPVTSFNVSSINGQTGDITGVAFLSDVAVISSEGSNSGVLNGTNSVARGENSTAFGDSLFVSGKNSNLSGRLNQIYSDNSKGSGQNNVISAGDNSSIEGLNNVIGSIGVLNRAIHVEGGSNTVGLYEFKDGKKVRKSPLMEREGTNLEFLHVEGVNNFVVLGYASHVEGGYNISDADFSHVEGRENVVQGLHSHAQNHFTEADGEASHSGGKGFSNDNRVTAKGVSSFNHSGSADTLPSSADAFYCAILGGLGNNISEFGLYSGIIGGRNSLITGQFSAIIGGDRIVNYGNNSVVLGGVNHVVDNDVANSSIISGTNTLADRDNTAYTQNIEIIGECSMLERQATQSQNTSSQIKWLIDLTKGNMFNCFTDNKSSVILDFTKPNPNQKSSTFVIDLKDTNTDEKTLAFTTSSDMDIFYTDDTIDVGVDKKTEIWGRYSKSDNAIYLSTNGGFIKAN